MCFSTAEIKKKKKVCIYVLRSRKWIHQTASRVMSPCSYLLTENTLLTLNLKRGTRTRKHRAHTETQNNLLKISVLAFTVSTLILTLMWSSPLFFFFTCCTLKLLVSNAQTVIPVKRDMFTTTTKKLKMGWRFTGAKSEVTDLLLKKKKVKMFTWMPHLTVFLHSNKCKVFIRK